MWATVKMGLIALVEIIQIIRPLLETIVMGTNNLIFALVDYFVLKKKRLMDQIEYERKSYKLAMDSQEAKEKANVAAFNGLIEESWRVRYTQILTLIQEEKFAEVLVLIREVDNPIYDTILFDTQLSPEYKAMKMVNEMKK